MKLYRDCPDCGGDGMADGSAHDETCLTCDGSGLVRAEDAERKVQLAEAYIKLFAASYEDVTIATRRLHAAHRAIEEANEN